VLGAGEVWAAEASADPVEVFWAEITRLRDLLKFEFYFQEREEHRRQVRAEMNRHDPRWEERLVAGEAEELLAAMRPLVSHVIVRPFVEAYRLVADVLAQDETLARDETPASRDEVIRQALGLGRQYVAQGRLRSAEPVSVLLFQTAFQLAGNQGLLAAGADVAARRAAFLAELRGLVRRLGRIEELAVRRYLTGA
jgi:glycerol-3-phosphate O-acyltransferase